MVALSRLSIFLCAVAVAAFVGCDSSEPKAIEGAGPLPPELKAGEAKFNANCAGCHGPQAKGTPQGPALVHKIYEPNHHGDAAFQRAAAFGVKAHHWEFGNMPKIDTVTTADVDDIIRYVRWLQRQAGIF